MYFLAIETSCDETAAAVFDDTPAVLSNVVASQTDLHARFGGVVPEVAARAHLQRLLPVIDEALDDAAGEAFDKVAAILGLGFPGGPAVEREAAGGNPKAFRFPRSFLHEDRLDFSFSGLKTAVLYTLR